MPAPASAPEEAFPLAEVRAFYNEPGPYAKRPEGETFGALVAQVYVAQSLAEE